MKTPVYFLLFIIICSSFSACKEIDIWTNESLRKEINHNLFINNIDDQSDNDITVKWYNIVYDQRGNEIEYIETDILNYDSTVVIRIIFNKYKENETIKCTLVDDKNNIIFEYSNIIKNNELIFRSVLLTTEDYLIDAELPFMRVKCNVFSKNKLIFESDYIETIFTYVVYVAQGPFAYTMPDQYILKSTDGYYEKTLNIQEDGIYGYYGYDSVEFRFAYIIPKKDYQLIYRRNLSENRIEDHNFSGRDKSFHELLNTVENFLEWNVQERNR